jgi:single-strand DNA-binding protein
VSFAKVVISGTLSSEPEKRFTPNNHAVTSFYLVVENPVTSSKPGAANEPFTVKVTCWRNLAEAVVTQLQKGDNVLVEGKLILNSFQGQDGVQKKVFEIDANSLDKLPGRPEPIIVAAGAGEGQSAPTGYDASARSSAPAYEASYTAPQAAAPVAGSTAHFSSEDLLTEDDIPF